MASKLAWRESGSKLPHSISYGTAATFTVVSSSLITTTVPVGANSGPVQVTTLGGVLTSNVPFRVKP
ncbi:MAG TPA: hypothetical protein VL523_17860 [Terriglobia bacterium]|nr:hypothetical protein [Terriglobia bacterium]